MTAAVGPAWASLKRSRFFAGLDDDALVAVAAKISRVRFADGEFLCREGDVADRMFIVSAGTVAVVTTGDHGVPVTLNTCGPGDVVDVISIFEEKVSSASVMARGAAEVWTLDAGDFRSLLESHPKLTTVLFAAMSRDLHRARSFAPSLGLHRADPRLKIAFFDSKPYVEACFRDHNWRNYALHFFETRLTSDTIGLAAGADVVCPFVNDRLDAAVIEALRDSGVRLIAMRCAGYNNVDIKAAGRLGVGVVHVPAYSPYAVAEHAAALLLTLNRKTHRAYVRVREGNFSLNGLVGTDLHGKCAGVVGTGRVGKCLIRILHGFGMRVLAHDPFVDAQFAAANGVEYVPLPNLLSQADVISLHAPLTSDTHHLINSDAIARMKRGVILINTSRGALVDSVALIEGLKSGAVGAAGLDVYEEEEAYFFEDFSAEIMTDDVLARLISFGNVLVTSHQAFLTWEALGNIADITFDNIAEFVAGRRGAELSNAILVTSS